jgi:hypothetical protein
MDREQIIEWSREADIDWHKHWNDDESNRLEAFAKRVAKHAIAQDREAVALLIEKRGMQGYGTLAIAAEVRIKGGAL